MATHDPVKCELWTGLVGPCHLGIVGPSGSRTTVPYNMVWYCRICCLMALQWVGCLGLAISTTVSMEYVEGERRGRPEICIQHRGGQSGGKRFMATMVRQCFLLLRFCSSRCWMAIHDLMKCELWTGLVGPCHLGIVGPSGSRTTVL